VKVWDAQAGHELLTLSVRGQRVYPNSLAFSPDGHRLATDGDSSGTVRIYDATPLPEE
jgi:WD40 repeat protein